jgi:NAD(P)H-dependent FMN reductase
MPQLKEKVAAAIVLATPEYHGSFSSVLKLVIENLGFPSALAAGMTWRDTAPGSARDQEQQHQSKNAI